MYPTLSDTNIHSGNHYLIFTMYLSALTEHPGSAKILISPVPANQQSPIHLHIGHAGEYQLRLTDVTGSAIAKRTSRFAKGDHQLLLTDLHPDITLKNGLYLMEVRYPSGGRSVVKFVFRN